MTPLNSIKKRIAEAAGQMGMTMRRTDFATKSKDLAIRTLEGWNAIVPAMGAGALGLENFGEGATPTRNQSFQAHSDANPIDLMTGLHEMKMAPRHIEQVTESIILLLDNGYNANEVIRGGQQVEAGHASLARVVGRTSAMQLNRTASPVGMEAFGDDINRLATDDRLTTALMIMRPYENIMDKGLARVNQTSPVVTIRIPSPETYNWATTQDANSTSASRNGPTNTNRLRDLYRNPTPVNSAPKKIVALAANDSNQVLWNGTTNYYKTGKNVSLLDLSRNSALFTHAHVDRTDLVADGGVVDEVIVAITDPNGGSAVTEYFSIPTRSLDLSHFVITPSSKQSGERQVIMTAHLPINKDTVEQDKSASTIAAKLTDAKIAVEVRVTATLNIQNGQLFASGSVQMDLVPLASGAPISNATKTTFAGLKAEVAAYSVDVQFDEENQRKANLAVWMQYHEVQFMVPRGRIYFTEYSLTQDVDDNAVAATSSVMALGNGRRGLGIIVDRLNDISQNLAFSAQNPEIAAANALDDQSFASSLVKPTVVTTLLDFENEELNTMNESTRLTEMHGRFRARFLAMAAELFAKSLMLNHYKGGETPVFKVWVHSAIADVVIGILDYHNELQDQTTIASGADYSMLLPNGYRLDVIKSNMDCLMNRLYAVPVIESDMASVLSAASIRDCGMVTTNYTPSNNGAVVRRVATTSREIVMMSNPVGICMEIKGLSKQLGTFGYTPVALNADSSDALAA